MVRCRQQNDSDWICDRIMNGFTAGALSLSAGRVSDQPVSARRTKLSFSVPSQQRMTLAEKRCPTVFVDPKHGGANVDKVCVVTTFDVAEFDVFGNLSCEQRSELRADSKKNGICFEIRIYLGGLIEGDQRRIFPKFFYFGRI